VVADSRERWASTTATAWGDVRAVHEVLLLHGESRNEAEESIPFPNRAGCIIGIECGRVNSKYYYSY
jgi:hypothetical protein